MQLHQPTVLDEMKRLGARTVVVSFARHDDLAEWVSYFRRHFLDSYYRRQDLEPPKSPFETTIFGADPDRAAYQAYGLGKNSALRVYGPRILWQYVKWTVMGHVILKKAEDPLQRGGNFVVGRDRRIMLSHYGKDQSERPEISEILAALDC